MVHGGGKSGFEAVVRRLDGGPGVEAALCRIAVERGAVCLESTATGRRDGRYSIFGCDPVEEAVFARAKLILPDD